MRAMQLQPSLFGADGGDGAQDHPHRAGTHGPAHGPAVAPADWPEDLQALGTRLHARYEGRLRLGTSSWHFPGWAGMVWARPELPAALSRHGLATYAQHPLLRTVSLDRAFYRPLPASTYAALAAQVDTGFRFLVKAPSQVTDAWLRAPGTAAPLQPNPQFLDVDATLDLCVRPAAAGLGQRLGVLVFQLSPLPPRWLDDPGALHARLAALAPAVRDGLPPGAQAALEVRDATLLTPALAALLRQAGWRCALGLHDRLPPIEAQLPMLRAGWPGDLVCRWNLQRGQRYAQARDAWAPFNRLQAPDVGTRQALARVARATLEAGHHATITINNKAEGCAPLSVLELARLVDASPGPAPQARS
jgi:uncharacterized protein YecE (DUF72 family)